MRRPSAISFVIPSSENRKCRRGSSKGELMIGFSMTTWLIALRSFLFVVFAETGIYHGVTLEFRVSGVRAFLLRWITKVGRPTRRRKTQHFDCRGPRALLVEVFQNEGANRRNASKGVFCCNIGVQVLNWELRNALGAQASRRGRVKDTASGRRTRWTFDQCFYHCLVVLSWLSHTGLPRPVTSKIALTIERQ